MQLQGTVMGKNRDVYAHMVVDCCDSRCSLRLVITDDCLAVALGCRRVRDSRPSPCFEVPTALGSGLIIEARDFR